MNAGSSEWFVCESCQRQVSTLVNGNCLTCGSPVEGKSWRQMTAAQRASIHTCGVAVSSHVDGWDGNWLSCEAVAR